MPNIPGQSSLPLNGIRVLDVTQVWAGPYATRWLADMGAEVIKVESVQHPDSERLSARNRSPDGGDEFYFNRAARFNQVNCNKLGITLNFASRDGVDLFKRLVALSDVVVENYSVGVLDKFGLGYESLRQIRPDIIMMSMPGFGTKGPEAHYLSYGPVQEAVSGLISVTGYRPGEYLETGEFYADPINGSFAAAGLFAALFHRRRTGKGVYIDLAQSEAMIACLPELVLEYQLNGRVLEPVANRHPFKAPHGCYPCQGEDEWLVISVTNEREWQGLCEALGRPDLASDERFSTMRRRLHHVDELGKVLSVWAAGQDRKAAMSLLQSHGVPALAVYNIEEVIKDDHLTRRGIFDEVDGPWTGRELTVGVPAVIDGVRARIRRHAPGLGEHNREVLSGLLGLTDEELDRLEAERVIGTAPLR